MTADDLLAIRSVLEPVFAFDTAAPGAWRAARHPSTGHCVIAALIVQAQYGGKLLSTNTEGVSHWFNEVDGQQIDLTGDQFGHAPVRIAPTIYASARERTRAEINEETWGRYTLFVIRLLGSVVDAAREYVSCDIHSTDYWGEEARNVYKRCCYVAPLYRARRP